MSDATYNDLNALAGDTALRFAAVMNLIKGAGVTANYASSYIANNVTMTTGGTIYNVTSVTLSAGTWLIFFSCLNYHASSGGESEVWVSANSASTTGTYFGASIEKAGNASGYTSIGSVGIVVLATPTTVYLNAVSANSGSAAVALGPLESTPNQSGITAVRIA